MDPKRLQQIKEFTAAIVAEQNRQALGHYARLLQACGVRQLRIYRELVQL